MNEPSSHFSMADVSAKPETVRKALAAGTIILGEKAFGMLQGGTLPKGDPLAMAEIAGVMAAKQTPALIPLCHPISLSRAAVYCVPNADTQAVDVYCLAEITERTGVEMEALTGLQIALLTIWDLVKPVNAALEITNTRLLFKSGGKQGLWRHPELDSKVLPPSLLDRIQDSLEESGS